jgi:thiol-disulfide isomerase/thioredoxin
MHALDLKVGDEAEDFTLPTLDGGQTVTLSAYRGRKPVVLFFGSLTCPSVREKMAFVNELCEQHRRQAEFLFVYIREAHPAEDGEIPQNQHLSISISTAACLEERAQAAEELHRRFNPKPLVLLDDMYDSVADSYNAWPERFGVVGVDGRIKFTGGTPGELAAMLAAALQRG